MHLPDIMIAPGNTKQQSLDNPIAVHGEKQLHGTDPQKISRSLTPRKTLTREPIEIQNKRNGELVLARVSTTHGVPVT